MKVLVIGYGNPARGDDGLGPALVRALEQQRPPGVELERDFQLTVETAAALPGCDVVVFADAAVGCPGQVDFRPVAAEATPGAAFSSHHLEPADVAALARILYGWTGRAFVLAMGGVDFEDFKDGLSPEAGRVLEQALALLLAQIAGGFPGAAAGDASHR